MYSQRIFFTVLDDDKIVSPFCTCHKNELSTCSQLRPDRITKWKKRKINFREISIISSYNVKWFTVVNIEWSPACKPKQEEIFVFSVLSCNMESCSCHELLNYWSFHASETTEWHVIKAQDLLFLAKNNREFSPNVICYIVRYLSFSCLSIWRTA